MDHDKGQKSAISGRRLHWRLSTGFFAFSPGSLCNLVRRAPQNLEKVAKNPVEKIASNPVTSVAVMVFLGPESHKFPQLVLKTSAGKLRVAQKQPFGPKMRLSRHLLQSVRSRPMVAYWTSKVDSTELGEQQFQDGPLHVDFGKEIPFRNLRENRSAYISYFLPRMSN